MRQNEKQYHEMVLFEEKATPAQSLDKRISAEIIDFFGFREQPFSAAPNPRFMFITERHRSILAKLMYSVAERQGLSVVMGDIGTGKTTLARHFYDSYRDFPGNAAVFITNPQYPSAMQLLKSISTELEVPHKRSRVEQFSSLGEKLAEHYSEGRNVIIIIDEAQLLIGQHLEMLRQILNYETNREKLAQIILFGQTELAVRFRYKKALKSRIITSSVLDPFSLDELKESIVFRTRVAGRESPLFEEDALKEIYRFSRGILRTAIILCRNCMPISFLNGMKKIPKEVVEAAEEETMHGTR